MTSKYISLHYQDTSLTLPYCLESDFLGSRISLFAFRAGRYCYKKSFSLDFYFYIFFKLAFPKENSKNKFVSPRFMDYNYYVV